MLPSSAAMWGPSVEGDPLGAIWKGTALMDRRLKAGGDHRLESMEHKLGEKAEAGTVKDARG